MAWTDDLKVHYTDRGRIDGDWNNPALMERADGKKGIGEVVDGLVGPMNEAFGKPLNQMMGGLDQFLGGGLALVSQAITSVVGLFS